MKKPRALVAHVDSGSFEQAAYAACLEISAVANTRVAYMDDAKQWLAFCGDRGINIVAPKSLDVTAWVEEMRRRGCAAKTRARRIAALCSIYRRLKRMTDEDGNPAPVVKTNPFSIEDGPKRETALAEKPTPIASPDAIKKILATCDKGRPLDIRDTAIIRILWSTGARRASVAAMTFDRLRRERGDYVARLIGKGGNEVPVLIRGKAAGALTAWVEFMASSGITTGSIWRTKRGVLTEKGLWQMVHDRARLAGVKELISPHMFRVAFLTLNPASLEAKQSAAGHANPATTMLYDRASWRGRKAFEAMPEIEDAEQETDDG